MSNEEGKVGRLPGLAVEFLGGEAGAGRQKGQHLAWRQAVVGPGDVRECFPETYRRFCHMLDHQHPYFIEGKVEEDYGAFTITVDAVSRIEFNQERFEKVSVE